MGRVRAFGGVAVLVLALAWVTAPVAGAAPPANDRAADAVVVSALPYSVTIDLTDATVDGDDAALDARCEVETTHSVWFRYTPGYDSALGTSVIAGVPVDVPSDIATGSPGAMDVVACASFDPEGTLLEAGTTYYVRVAWRAGDPPEPPLTLHLTDVACNGTSGGDFDGDLCPDLAVGLPDATVDGVSRAGRVEVAYGNGYNSFEKRRQRLDPQDLGVALQPRSGFGATMAQGRLDGDGHADLAVGIPGLDAGTAQGAGAVLVLFGSPEGLGERHVLLRQGTGPGTGGREAGDRFGASLDIEDNRLLVGSPGEDIGDLADAGAAVLYSGFTSGSGSPTARFISQAGSVAGAAETGDLFGSAVTFGPLGMLVIGAPGEDVGSVSSAGAVVTIATNGTSAIVSQNTSGMAGVAEAGDRLGAAVAYLPDPFDDGYRLAAGAPGEDLSGIRDAGLLNFLVAPAHTSAPRPQAWAVGQDTAGVAGVAEPGDRFGSVLATWSAFHAIDLLVGVPDEDIGAATDAGAVTTLHLEGVGSRTQPVVGRTLTQSTTRVVGTPEPGDRLGAALSTTGADPDDDDGAYDTVYAGVPGEDTSGVTDVGFTQAVTSPFTTIAPMERLSGQRFGAALGHRW